MAVEGAENPAKLGNPKGSAGARAGGILDHVAREVRLAETGIQAEPGCRLELDFRAGVIRIEGNLIEIPAQLRNQAELVLRIRVVNQRSEAAEAVGSIVDDRRGGSLQSEIGTVSVHAGVIGKAIGVATEVQLVVGLTE